MFSRASMNGDQRLLTMIIVDKDSLKNEVFYKDD